MSLKLFTQPENAPAQDKPVPDNYRCRPRPRRRRAARALTPRRRDRPPMAERLLRNSVIACALLLAVLTLGNIRQPWAEKASQGIERALTMRIDLDRSIGGLSFVREIMPESAMVFFSVASAQEAQRPVSGDVTHPWTDAQPWLMLSCAENEAVLAVKAGTVSAVSPLSRGGYGLLIDHGGGCESVYANLAAVSVAMGDEVASGQPVAVGGGQDIYFEWRRDGEPADPGGLWTPQ